MIRSCCLAAAAIAGAAAAAEPALTPGAIDPALTRARVCASEFRTASARHVPGALRRAVFAAYGMSPHAPPCPCELDHLIPIELGGANVFANLWPQPLAEARMKNKLEGILHRLVCTGALDLRAAQEEIVRSAGH